MEGHAHPQLGVPVAFLVQFGLEAQDCIGAAAQDYLPEELRGLRYYTPTRYGAEARYFDVLERVMERLSGKGERSGEGE